MEGISPVCLEKNFFKNFMIARFKRQERNFSFLCFKPGTNQPGQIFLLRGEKKILVKLSPENKIRRFSQVINETRTILKTYLFTVDDD